MFREINSLEIQATLAAQKIIEELSGLGFSADRPENVQNVISDIIFKSIRGNTFTPQLQSNGWENDLENQL